MKKFQSLFAFLLISLSINVFAYKLPYPSGVTYKVTQGPNGGTSHTDKMKYAYDFGMPEGSNVVAIASGKVKQIKINSNKSCATSACANDANYIVIEHVGGVASAYYHLKQYSSSLKVGDSVTQGDVIAKSGNTGWSTGAHLHLQLQTVCGSWYCQSLSLVFDESNGQLLKTGSSYTSKNIKNVGSTPAPSNTLKSLGVTCNLPSLKVLQSATCQATAYYTNGTNKTVTGTGASWVLKNANVNNNTIATINSQGVVTAKGTSVNSIVNVHATYSENGVVQQNSVKLTIEGVDGKSPIELGCTSDEKMVNYKVISGSVAGTIALMYSAKCGTNWAKAIPLKNTSKTNAKIMRMSDGRSYQYSGTGRIYTPMVFSPTTKACASGAIDTLKVIENTVCK